MLLVFILCSLLGLPSVIVVKTVEFLNNPKVVSSVEWGRDEKPVYPNLTFCHPKYFDTRKMEGKEFPKG